MQVEISNFLCQCDRVGDDDKCDSGVSIKANTFFDLENVVVILTQISRFVSQRTRKPSLINSTEFSHFTINQQKKTFCYKRSKLLKV